MLEVTQTGSPYFERAFLVVRSGGQQPTAEQLQIMAEKVVRQAETYAGLRKQKRIQRWRHIGLTVSAAVVGAFLCWIIQQILG